MAAVVKCQRCAASLTDEQRAGSTHGLCSRCFEAQLRLSAPENQPPRIDQDEGNDWTVVDYTPEDEAPKGSGEDCTGGDDGA